MRCNNFRWILQRLSFTQCPNCSYFILTWKRLAVEYHHTHTPTATDREKTECALCAQLFISISPVLRGTKWAFKLQSPESSVAGGQAALRCLGGGGIHSFTGVAHLTVHPWFWEGLGLGRSWTAGAAGIGESEKEPPLTVGASAGQCLYPKGRQSETPSIHKQRSHFTHHKGNICDRADSRAAVHFNVSASPN